MTALGPMAINFPHYEFRVIAEAEELKKAEVIDKQMISEEINLIFQYCLSYITPI